MRLCTVSQLPYEAAICMAFHSLAPGAMSGEVASPHLYIGNDRQADFVSRAV